MRPIIRLRRAQWPALQIKEVSFSIKLAAFEPRGWADNKNRLNGQ
jgi:hypothetical protein